MKSNAKFFGFTAFAAVIWLAFSGCSDPDIGSGKNSKTTEMVFTTAGQPQDWSMPMEITYPATIEVYVLGAGGGGQGGFYSWKPLSSDRRGTGGAGGGGAAAYMKFETNQRLTFNVTVGSGGVGGNARDSDLSNWSAGYSGSQGGSSSVSWGANTLTARGGIGGGGSGNRNLSGGTGGTANTSWPSGNVDRHSAAGGNGTSGDDSNDTRSVGGNAAEISRGSTTFGGGGGAVRSGGVWARPVNGSTGGGGSGAYGGEGSNNHGGRGGDGRVHIIIKWYE